MPTSFAAYDQRHFLDMPDEVPGSRPDNEPHDEIQLDELVGFVAAEANHETNRGRRKRLDETFAVLNDAVKDVDVGRLLER